MYLELIKMIRIWRLLRTTITEKLYHRELKRSEKDDENLFMSIDRVVRRVTTVSFGKPIVELRD